MKFVIVWHSVTDQDFMVEGDDEDDALERLSIALSEGDLDDEGIEQIK
jgi:hypothetical protein